MMNRQHVQILSFALGVLVPTTLIAGCLWQFQVTNNWAANVLMFVPGLVAAILRLRWGEGFKVVGRGIGEPIYWLWSVLLPIIAFAVSLPISLVLRYAAPASN